MVNTGPLIIEGNEDYYSLLKTADPSSVIYRQAKMATSDPYYSILYKTVNASQGHLEAVRAIDVAGCIDHRLDERITPDTRFLSAPYDVFKQNATKISAGKKPAVVLSSGSFDPLHTGHVETLVRSREFIDNNTEYEVIGGLLSGGHDEYVRVKNPGGINSHGRFAKNDDILYRHSANHDTAYGNKQWIFLESMESTFSNQAINFTDVIEHVQAMCERYVAEGVKVFFIFGSDNAGFGLTFTHNRADLADGICVYRPGYDIEPTLKAKLDASSTVHCINGFSAESSTHVRKGLTPVDEFNHRIMGVKNDADSTMGWISGFFAEEEEFVKRSFVFREALMGSLAQSFDRVVEVPVQATVIAEKYDDVVAISDFMLGSTTPPKLHPFVNVSIEASVIPALNREFNRALWKANVNLFARTGITVNDMPAVQGNFMKYLGFKDTETVESIGRYFLARFV